MHAVAGPDGRQGSARGRGLLQVLAARLLAARLLTPALLVAACGGRTPPSRGCGDVIGAWSAPVDGVRARLVTTRAAGVRGVSLDVENTGGEPRELRWLGYLDAGFATFRLLDGAGHEPPPVLAWGGNALGGALREVLPVGRAVRHVIGRDLVVVSQGRRLVRIGAFGGGWELPADGAPRFLAARLASDPSVSPTLRLEVDPERELSTHPDAEPPHGRPWAGPLDVPPVCVD